MFLIPPSHSSHPHSSSSKTSYKRKRQLQQIEKDQANDNRRLRELQQRGEVLDGEIRGLMEYKNTHDKALSSMQEQMESAKSQFSELPNKGENEEQQKAIALKLANDAMETMFRASLEEL